MSMTKTASRLLPISSPATSRCEPMRTRYLDLRWTSGIRLKAILVLVLIRSEHEPENKIVIQNQTEAETEIEIEIETAMSRISQSWNWSKVRGACVRHVWWSMTTS